jgi:hypothetical protein
MRLGAEEQALGGPASLTRGSKVFMAIVLEA